MVGVISSQASISIGLSFRHVLFRTYGMAIQHDRPGKGHSSRHEEYAREFVFTVRASNSRVSERKDKSASSGSKKTLCLACLLEETIKIVGGKSNYEKYHA